jgi:hypothetical protein
MNSSESLKQCFRGVAMIAAAIALVAGCNQGVPGEPKTESINKLPKMKFHRPDSFPMAVSRLVEIHQLILSESPLPDPKVFQVVEVVHGSGPGAHSHYHLANDPSGHSHAHNDDHAVEESNEKRHEVEVDVITEMSDIIKWLPEIAGDTDMNKDLWGSVKSKSGSMQSELNGALAKATSQQEKREAIRSVGDQFVVFNDSMAEVVEELKKSDRENQELPED